MNISIRLLLGALMALLSVNWVFLKVLKIAKMKGLVDNPNARKLQKMPIPVLGGVAVFFGMVMGMMVFVALCKMYPLEKNQMDDYALVTLLSCATIMLYVGSLDDMLGLSPKARLALEVVTVLFMVLGSGMCVDSLHGLWGIQHFSWWVAVPLTVFASVGLINAYNMVDGVNGLSSGLCITGSFLMAVLFWKRYDYENCAMALCFGASLIPFFMHNVFGNRSRMFIGDGGTMVMGLLVSWFMIRVLSSENAASYYLLATENRQMGLVAMMLSVVSVPVFDTLRVMVGRIARRVSPFRADKTHLHHKFIAIGVSHSVTALSEIVLNILIVGIWYLSYRLGATVTAQLYITIVVSMLIIWGTYFYLRKNENRYIKTQTTNSLTEWAKKTHLGQKKWWLRLQTWLDKNAYEYVDEMIERKMNKLSGNVDFDENARDIKAIVNYLQGKKNVDVRDVVADSGVDVLNVYPILFKLEKTDVIQVTKRNEFGSPTEVRFVNSN